MKKILIYSCICGGYDKIEQPCAAPDDFDFVLFVPKGEKEAGRDGVWRVEELPVAWKDSLVSSRFPKMCPHSLLEDYDFSLWIDGNITIRDPKVFDMCRELASRDIKYASIRHPERDCVYEECEKVLKDDRESIFRLLHIVHFLKKNGLGRHEGLMENGVIFRKHNDPAVVEFDRLWWDWFLSHSPRRDQLVHTLCLKETPSLEVEYLLPEGQSVHNSELFGYRRHPSKPLTWLQRKWKFGRLWPARWLLHLYISLSVPGNA